MFLSSMEFFNLGRVLLEANKTEEDDCHDKCGPSSGNQHVPPLVIIIVATLGTCFLLVSYYAIIVKYCSFWNSTRRQPPRTEEHDTHQEFLDEEHRPVVDHPIWNIVTVGLAESIINSISICKYKKGDGLVEGNDCSICLSEFEEDESLRLLPKCSHAFHLPCIDTWLKSHTNCPLCRAPIVSAATTGSTSPTPPELTDSSPQEEIQTEISERENGASHMSGDGEGEGDGDVTTPIVNLGFRVPSDLTDKYWVQENEMQPMRRSFSMDFSPVRTLANSVQVEVVGSSGFELERGKKSRGRSSQRVPISMKRSLSTGAKFLLSRHSRSQSSILPLVVLDTLRK